MMIIPTFPGCYSKRLDPSAIERSFPRAHVILTGPSREAPPGGYLWALAGQPTTSKDKREIVLQPGDAVLVEQEGKEDVILIRRSP